MSRVGKAPIPLPGGVSWNVQGPRVHVKGPKGELSRPIARGITFAEEDKAIVVKRPDDTQQARANHGLMRALVANMVKGVSKGFERKLEIQGIGYRAEVKGKTLLMNLGYSHQVEYPFPPGIDIKVEANTKLTVAGIDNELVGQVAAELRSKRPPDSYKGKGVRYDGEHVRLKAGKTSQ